MLRGRLALHPRHLIPARSRLPHAEQVALFVANVEKEFGSVARVPDLDAVPEAVADYLAAQNLPTRHRDGAASGAAGDPLGRRARCCACARAAPRRPTW